MSIQKIFNYLISFIVFSAFCLSLITLSYSINYYLNYNGENSKLIGDFRAIHQDKNSESEFNELCSKIKPANFEKVYFGLMDWSSKTLKISAMAVFIDFIYSLYLFLTRKKANLRRTGILLIILFLSFVFYWYSIDTEYNILYCLLPYMQ